MFKCSNVQMFKNVNNIIDTNYCNKMSIILCSCWYPLKAKFDNSVYLEWIDNLLQNVNNFYLVIYANEEGSSQLSLSQFIDNPRIRVVFKPIEEFYNFQFKEQWIRNHEQNELLNQYTSWELNMLWSEKIHFVSDCREKKYFNSNSAIEMYGWCDIGYFRNRVNADTPIQLLEHWPSQEIICDLDTNKIHYALVNNDTGFIKQLMEQINEKDADDGLPVKPIPQDQISVAGGFFILSDKKIEWWKDTYDSKLQTYFASGRLVKDDQIILADCIFTKENQKFFALYTEESKYDNWFLFQRHLLEKQISILLVISSVSDMKYLQQCLASVFSQSYTSWDLKIGVYYHNNIRNPQLLNIIKNLVNGISDSLIREKIRVIELNGPRNKQAALNILATLTSAETNYIALLEPDSIWTPDKLLQQSKHMYYYDVISTNPNIRPGDITRWNFNKVNPILPGTTIMLKQLFFLDESHGNLAEQDLWIRLQKAGISFLNVDPVR